MSGKGHYANFRFKTPQDARNAFQNALKKFSGTGLTNYLSRNECVVSLDIENLHFVSFHKVQEFLKTQNNYILD